MTLPAAGEGAPGIWGSTRACTTPYIGWCTVHRGYGARWCTGGVRMVHAGVDLKTHHAAGRRTQAHGSHPSFLIRPIRFQFNLLIGVVPFEVGCGRGLCGLRRRSTTWGDRPLDGCIAAEPASVICVKWAREGFAKTPTQKRFDRAHPITGDPITGDPITGDPVMRHRNRTMISILT